MRRITVYCPDDRAGSLVAHLERSGYDFMSEEYRDPGIVRRAVPERRDAPERHVEDGPTGSAALLPARPAKTVPTKLPAWLLYRIGMCPDPLAGMQKTALYDAAEDSGKGWTRKQIRDTVKRMISDGRLKWQGDKVFVV